MLCAMLRTHPTCVYGFLTRIYIIFFLFYSAKRSGLTQISYNESILFYSRISIACCSTHISPKVYRNPLHVDRIFHFNNISNNNKSSFFSIVLILINFYLFRKNITSNCVISAVILTFVEFILSASVVETYTNTSIGIFYVYTPAHM